MHQERRIPCGARLGPSLGLLVSLQEKQKLLDEIEDLTVQLTEEQEKKRKMGDKLSQERHQFQKEKESTQEVSGAWACHTLVPKMGKSGAVGAAWAEERGSAAELQHFSHLCCSEIHPTLSLHGAVPPWPLPFLPGRRSSGRGTWSQQAGAEGMRLGAECLGAGSHPPSLPIIRDSSWRPKQGWLWGQERSFGPQVELDVTVVSLRALG